MPMTGHEVHPGLRQRRLEAAAAAQGVSWDEGIYSLIEEIAADYSLSGKVLDYGAGIGNLSRRLVTTGRFTEVCAADIIAAPPRLDGITWLSQDLNEPLAGYDEYFDAIVASEVVEHLENPRAMLRDLFRMCRPGGHAIVTTPNNESVRSLVALVVRGHFVYFDKGWYPGHIVALLRKDLTRIFCEAGFEPPAFRFTRAGSLPGSPSRTWQQISFGTLGGVRFSNNLAAIARKPVRE
jgi:2-polyprenyl-3-methyl-5-hydroxy-6-metoxy-1,4-benzoquinol methylase